MKKKKWWFNSLYGFISNLHGNATRPQYESVLNYDLPETRDLLDIQQKKCTKNKKFDWFNLSNYCQQMNLKSRPLYNVNMIWWRNAVVGDTNLNMYNSLIWWFPRRRASVEDSLGDKSDNENAYSRCQFCWRANLTCNDKFSMKVT